MNFIFYFTLTTCVVQKLFNPLIPKPMASLVVLPFITIKIYCYNSKSICDMKLNIWYQIDIFKRMNCFETELFQSISNQPTYLGDQLMQTTKNLKEPGTSFQARTTS